MNNTLSQIESEYKHKKLSNKLKRAKKLLNINWKEVNKTREELGLPKVSNETTRKAYLDNLYQDDMIEELELELKYNMLSREYYEEMKQ